MCCLALFFFKQKTAYQMRISTGVQTFALPICKAVANHDSVADWEGGIAMVKAAVDNFGSIDAVVNNAGNLRDMFFHKMGPDDFEAEIGRASCRGRVCQYV